MTTISYGPHTNGRGHPEQYIRTKNLTTWYQKQAHAIIIASLTEAFMWENPASILSQLKEKQSLDCNKTIELSFINYGNTELVYKAIVGMQKYVVLINQPHTPPAKILEEYGNLQRLHQMDPRFVVEPYAYYDMSEKGYALYVAAYSEDALCIAHHSHTRNIIHGVYNTLPHYHFEIFSPEMSSIIHTAMIALLVNYYDTRTQTGLAQVHMSGNDFMLAQPFSHDDVDVIPHMKLIAARGTIHTSFEAYLRLLRKEFVRGTQYTDKDVIDQKIQVNHRSAVPLTAEEIEQGIQLGLSLRG